MKKDLKYTNPSSSRMKFFRFFELRSIFFKVLIYQKVYKRFKKCIKKNAKLGLDFDVSQFDEETVLEYNLKPFGLSKELQKRLQGSLDLIFNHTDRRVSIKSQQSQSDFKATLKQLEMKQDQIMSEEVSVTSESSKAL